MAKITRLTCLLAALTLSPRIQAGEPQSGDFDNPKRLSPRQSKIPAEAPPICDLRVKQPKLSPGNQFRCRGIPFEVTFPKAYIFEQHHGNGWLSWQHSPTGQVILLSVRAAAWTLYKNRWGEVDDYLPRLFKSLPGLISPEIGTPETVSIPGADFARKVGFSAGDAKTGTAGVSLSVIVKGWVMHLMITGKKGYPLRRGGAYSESILSSVKAVPRSAPVLHKFRNGMTVELPHDVWVSIEKDNKGLPNPTYMTAGDMTIIRVVEGKPIKPCDQLTQQDWNKIIGSVKNQPGQKGRILFGYSYWLDIGGIRSFWANADLPAHFSQETGRQRDPATATLMCHKNTLFQMFTVATRSTRRQLSKQVEAILVSFH